MNKIIKCKKCGKLKPHWAKGLCHSCYNEQWQKANPEKNRKSQRKWQQNNPEKHKKMVREWRKNNPEYKKQYWQKNKEELQKEFRKYYQINKEREKERKRKWEKNHPDKIREYGQKWTKNNPDKIREKNLKRRTKGTIKRGIISKLINENIFKYGIITCEKCKKECENNFHVDHIVPISRGGTNDYSNLQILCQYCNLSKRTNITDYRERENNKQLFLKEVQDE